MSQKSIHYSKLQEVLDKYKFCRENRDQLIPHLLTDNKEILLMYPIVKTIAKDTQYKEQPFALDEFPLEKHFMEYATSGFCIAFRKHPLGKPEAFGFVAPSLFHRSDRPLYADLRICTLDRNPQIGMLQELLSCLVEVAKGVGYMGCIYDTFMHNFDAIEAARRSNFQNIMILPDNGLVVGKGYMHSLLFFKPLISSDKPFPAPTDEAVQHLPELRYRDLEVPKNHPHLPVSRTLGDGTQITINPFELKHIDFTKELFENAISRGQGFGTDEHPPDDVLTDTANRNGVGHGFVAELPNGKVVGVMFLTPSPLSRSQCPANADCYILIDPSHGSKGLASMFSWLSKTLSYEIGYKGILSDTYLDNLSMIRMLYKTQYVCIGSVWRTGYLRGKGYTDTVFHYAQSEKAISEKAISHCLKSSNL